MFYEEKVIGGRLYSRTSPNGAWVVVPAEKLTANLMAARTHVRLLEAELERIKRKTSSPTPWIGDPWRSRLIPGSVNPWSKFPPPDVYWLTESILPCRNVQVVSK